MNGTDVSLVEFLRRLFFTQRSLIQALSSGLITQDEFLNGVADRIETRFEILGGRIPTSERLPETDDLVVVWTKASPSPIIAFYDSDYDDPMWIAWHREDWDLDELVVTFWMPLPE